MYVTDVDQTIENITLECGFADMPCIFVEGVAQGLGQFMLWIADGLLGSQSFAPGSGLWNTAIEETGVWLGVSTMIAIAVAIIGISTGMITLSTHKVWKSILGFCAMIPALMVALTLLGALLDASDKISEWMIERLGGPDGFAALFKFGLTGGSGNDVAGAAKMALTGMQGGVQVILMCVLIIIGLLLISFALAFRNLALMVLVAFSPLAFMATGMPSGWQITKKWFFASIALLLAKPLMLGMLTMMLKSVDTLQLFSMETVTIGMGMFLVAFMPLAAFQFFNFLGGAAEGDAGMNTGREAANKAKQGGQQAGRLFGGLVGGGARGAAGARGGAGAAGGAKPPVGGGGSPGGTSGGQGSGGGTGGGKSNDSSKPGGGTPGGPSPEGSSKSGDSKAPGSQGSTTSKPQVPEPRQKPAGGRSSSGPSSRPAW